MSRMKGRSVACTANESNSRAGLHRRVSSILHERAQGLKIAVLRAMVGPGAKEKQLQILTRATENAIDTWRGGLLTALRIACVATSVGASAVEGAECNPTLGALVRLGADRIEAVFHDVAASTRTLGRTLGSEYRTMVIQRAQVANEDSGKWGSRIASVGDTTRFRTWSDGAPTPGFQDPMPAIYSYDHTIPADAVAFHLREFKQSIPVFRAAYRSFDSSWVYVSTSDEMILIYPYAPVAQAVNNARPSGQVFYMAADFAHREVGWTRPYPDLVGAGMMITASYSVFAGERLLGVVSRDATLKQLSRSVLNGLTSGNDLTAFIVDQHGLVVDASDPVLESELERVNRQSNPVAPFYRSPEGMTRDASPGAVTSQVNWVNEVTERVLALSSDSGAPDVIDTQTNGRKVPAARIKSTGWFIVLVDGV